MPKAHTFERSSWNRPRDDGLLGDAARFRILHNWLTEELAGLPDDAPAPLGTKLHEQLAELGDRGDDEPVTVSQLRGYLEKIAPSPLERGAQLRDVDSGVIYRVTPTADPGSVGTLRTIEVIVPAGYAYPRDFRLPVPELRRHAAAVIELEDEITNDDGAAGIVVGHRVEPPTPERLAELLSKGVTRQVVADTYGRSLSRVDQWIGEGRRTHPELDWPAKRRAPSS